MCPIQFCPKLVVDTQFSGTPILEMVGYISHFILLLSLSYHFPQLNLYNSLATCFLDILHVTLRCLLRLRLPVGRGYDDELSGRHEGRVPWMIRMVSERDMDNDNHGFITLT